MFNMYNYAMRTCVLPNVLRQLSIYNVITVCLSRTEWSAGRIPLVFSPARNTHTYCLYIHTYTHAYTCVYVYTYTYTRIHMCTRDSKFYL